MTYRLEVVNLMSSTAKFFGLGLLLLALSAIRVEAITVPVTEDFTGSTAAWKNNANTDLTLKSGGPDGDYVSTDFTFGTATSQTPVIVRAQSNFSSSSNAFFGDWVAGGATKLRVNVRHNDALGSLPIFGDCPLRPLPALFSEQAHWCPRISGRRSSSTSNSTIH